MNRRFTEEETHSKTFKIWRKLSVSLGMEEMQNKAMTGNPSGCQNFANSYVSKHVEHWKSCTLFVGV